MNATSLLTNTSVDLNKFDLSKLERSKAGRPRILTPEIEALIPKLIDEGYTKNSIAKVFGVSIWTIRGIKRQSKEASN